MKKIFNENIVVAPAGFDETIGSVDYVCTGENDQVTIQAAIDRCIAENKNIYLLNGIYNIDGFYDIGDGGPMTALHFPRCHREIVFKGQNHEYGFQVKFNNGVVLYVTEKALETIVDKETDVIRGDWTDRGCQNGSSLNFENITIILNDNQHAIRCIDFRKTDRVVLFFDALRLIWQAFFLILSRRHFKMGFKTFVKASNALKTAFQGDFKNFFIGLLH